MAPKGFESSYVEIYRRKSSARELLNIIQETSLRIVLNGTQIATIACCGNHLEELAVGFLWSEGIISNATDIREIIFYEQNMVHVHTKNELFESNAEIRSQTNIASSGARAVGEGFHIEMKGDLSKKEIFVSLENILSLMDRLIELSSLHSMTGGTHSGALAKLDTIIAVREDIGRHNVIDMLGGYVLMNNINCDDKFIIRTGRVSAEIVSKVINIGVPVIASLSVPTLKAIRMCDEFGLTLIGSVRGDKMNVYSHAWRIRN